MGTFVVALIVAGLVAFAIYSLLKDKKNGKSCGGDCAACMGCGKARGDSAGRTKVQGDGASGNAP